MSNFINNKGENNGGWTQSSTNLNAMASTNMIPSESTSSNIDIMSRFSFGSPSKSSFPSLSFSSYHNSNQQQLGSPLDSTRRPSGNQSRVSHMYNNSLLNSTGSNNTYHLQGINNEYNHSRQTSTSPQIPTAPHFVKPLVPTERMYFQASSEILACDRSWETPNLIAIATPRNLQLLKVSTTDISLETDLVIKQNGRKKISTISDLAFGHQNYGRYLAASTITGSISIYHFDRGTRVKTVLSGHNRAVNTIDFNHINSSLLASGSQDGKIHIWDIKTSSSKPAMTLNCNADAVRCCSFHNKKQNTLAAVFDSGVVEKWDLRKTTTWERRINAHTGPALTVHWHPELDYIVTGGRDKQLQVWNLEGSNDIREPSHVINTTGPISKARWCKGRGNGSIMNTDIAVSYFNDDPNVHIWNLNRKFIPKSIIDGHSAQITQILWRTPKHLISCSKDKTLIQYDVTKEKEFIENIPNGAIAWCPTNTVDFAFVKQTKAQFQGPFNMSANASRAATNELNPVDEADQSNASVGSSINSNQNVGNIGINTATNENSGMQLYEMLSKSPGNGNSVGGSSSLQKHKQGLSRQPSYINKAQIPTPKNLPPPAWITPVHVPLLSNDLEKLHFLSTNYLIRLPPSSDITEVCEFNSMVAASVGLFRDSQTWKSIQMAINLDEEVKHSIIAEEKLKNFTFENSNKVPYSRSDSQLGSSFNSASELVGHRRRESKDTSGGSFKESELSMTYGSEPYEFTRGDESAIIDEEDAENEVQTDTEGREDSGRKLVNGGGDENHTDKCNTSESQSTRSKVGSVREKLDQVSLGTPSLPFSQASRRGSHAAISRYRYSFTGSSIDLDDEKHGSPLSLGGSPILSRSRSRLILQNFNARNIEETIMPHINKVDTRASKISDAKSQLTAIMKEEQNSTLTSTQVASTSKEDGDDASCGQKDRLVVPWNPTDMIKKACEYSSEQGDVLMCATLSLLFERSYPAAFSKMQAEEWIYTYHEYLLRCGYFNNAATILRIACESHESFKKIGQTKTSVRLLCCHCQKPLLNERSREKYKKNLNRQLDSGDADVYRVDFGFWYCDRCRRLQGQCCYCVEPIKGNAVALIGCGHEGHFGCFRTWFLEQGETECPSCGTTCIH